MRHPWRDVLIGVFNVRRVSIVVIVIALTIADAALVYAALNRTYGNGSVAAASTSVVTFSPATPVTSTAAPSATSTAQPASGPQPASRISAAAGEQGRLLSATSTTAAWRANGGCTGKPHLAGTTDGAKSWTAIAAPAPHLLRIDLTAAGTGWVIGTNASCGSPTYYTTSNGGTSWSSAGLGQVWLPEATGVRTPVRRRAAPCGHGTAPVQLASAGVNDAIVACPKGVERTTNAGATWSAAGTVPGGQVAAVSLEGSGQAVLVLTGAAHCGGLRVLTSTDTGAHWVRGKCLGGATTPAAVSLTSGGAGLLVSAGRSYATTDAGAHWS